MADRAAPALATLAACVLLGGAACPAALVEPTVGGSPRRVAAGASPGAMNRTLLDARLTRTIVVELDWVEGCEPSEAALSALEAALRDAVPPSIPIETAKDVPFPRRRAEELGDPAEIARYALRHLPRPDRGVAGLYVLFAPGRPKDVSDRLGERVVWRVEDDGIRADVDGIVIYSEAIRDQRLPRVTAEAIEAMVLVHEVGHVLGLVHDPAHESAAAEGHCADPLCVMAYPGWRTLLLNAPRALILGRPPSRFCEDCRDDIARARVP